MGGGAVQREGQDVFNGYLLTAGQTDHGHFIQNHTALLGLQSDHFLFHHLQVDLGGIPATLVNYISKRQPLAVAYLRDYLISTSLQASAVHTKSSPY